MDDRSEYEFHGGRANLSARKTRRRRLGRLKCLVPSSLEKRRCNSALLVSLGFDPSQKVTRRASIARVTSLRLFILLCFLLMAAGCGGDVGGGAAIISEPAPHAPNPVGLDFQPVDLGVPAPPDGVDYLTPEFRVDVVSVTFHEAKRDSPISRNRDAPVPLEIAFQRVKPLAGQSEVRGLAGIIEVGPRNRDKLRHLGPHPVHIPALMQAFGPWGMIPAI